MNSLIQIKNLSVRYGSNRALANISLDVFEGEYLGIIGPNGGGKTTLLKAMLGLIPIEVGSVSVCGRQPGKTGTLIGYVPQFSAMEKDFPITVREVVLSGRLSHGSLFFHRYSAEDRNSAAAAMREVGIADLAGRQINALSGGEFQKMLIARALAVGPKILFLDEPTASVDAKSRSQIYVLLNRLNQKGMTILLITHDTAAVRSQVHRVACLNRRLIYQGTPELDSKTVNALYGGPPDAAARGLAGRTLKAHMEGN